MNLQPAFHSTMNIFQKTAKSIRPKNVFQKLLNGVDGTWTGSSHSEWIPCENHHKKGLSRYREYCSRTYTHTKFIICARKFHNVKLFLFLNSVIKLISLDYFI